MRRLATLGFLLSPILSGCQLLPSSDVPCSESSRCAQIITAPFVLGQPDEKTNWLQTGMGRVTSVLLVPGKLIAADPNYNRVLIWNSFPTKFNQPPDQWLGEPDLSVLSYNVPDALAVRTPTRLASDGSRLIIAADQGSNNYGRTLLFWNKFPTGNYLPYDFQINSGSQPVVGPRSYDGANPLVAGGRMYVSDRGFHRLLHWNSVPTAAADANLVIGQKDLMTGTANAMGVSASSLNGPDGTPATDGTTLFVSDTQNHRVLAYNPIPTANTPAASFVLGQSSLTANSANSGGASLSTMNSPAGLSIGGTRLALADRANHRVLLWNTIPTATGQAADLVLGQANGGGTSSNSGGLSGSTLNNPQSVTTDGTRIAVADTNNNRILLWNSWPTSSGTRADVVLGQSSLTNNGTTGEVASAQRLLCPTSIAHAGSRFIVVDSDGNRVLIWPQFPLTAAAQPTVVLGQSDLNTSSANSGGVSAGTLYSPQSASSDGTILAVADTANNRVLLWNSIPNQNRQPADLVIGQPNTNSSSSTPEGAPLGLNSPNGVFVSGGRLYVADTYNNRVLIWKSIPTQNQQAADIVLGQADFKGTEYAHKSLDIDATTLAEPRAVYADAGHIYVSDTDANRVLIWNTLEPSNGQAADVVLGASTFADYGRYYGVGAVQTYRGRLYVADAGSSRILVWNSVPTQNGLPPTAVVGQPNLQATSPNTGGLSANVLQRPNGFLVVDIGIFVADTGNGRVVGFPPLP